MHARCTDMYIREKNCRRTSSVRRANTELRILNRLDNTLFRIITKNRKDEQLRLFVLLVCPKITRQTGVT